MEKVPQGLGSGFIWDLKGHIVTNYHVSTCLAEVAALSGMARRCLCAVRLVLGSIANTGRAWVAPAAEGWPLTADPATRC